MDRLHRTFGLQSKLTLPEQINRQGSCANQVEQGLCINWVLLNCIKQAITKEHAFRIIRPLKSTSLHAAFVELTKQFMEVEFRGPCQHLVYSIHNDQHGMWERNLFSNVNPGCCTVLRNEAPLVANVKQASLKLQPAED